MNLVEKSLELATKAHEGQFRRDGRTAYISHPIAVSGIINNWLSSNEREVGGKLYELIFQARQEALSFGIKSKQFREILDIVSLAHDLEEDCKDKGFTIDWLITELKKYSEAFSGYDTYYPPVFFLLIAKSLRALTHAEGETYLNYILRAKQDKISLIIKIGDITHNISTRNGSNTAGEIKKDKLAIEKYELAKFILLN